MNRFYTKSKEFGKSCHNLELFETFFMYFFIFEDIFLKKELIVLTHNCKQLV